MIVVAAVVERAGRFLVTRRQHGVHLEGYWEFPGGKVDPGEDHQTALRRELREELDVDCEPGELMLTTAHDYDDRRITLCFYRCTLGGTPRALLGQEVRWATRDDLGQLRFPPADDELIRLVRRSPGEGGRA